MSAIPAWYPERILSATADSDLVVITPFPAALISQPRLGGFTSRVPDFLWLATDSATVTPLFIEIERPSKAWWTGDGNQTAELAQALNQIAEWKVWFSKPENQQAFVRFYRFPDRLDFRALTPSYLLIYGRRADANRTSELNLKRSQIRPENTEIMTFDRLSPMHDQRKYLCVGIDEDGYVARRVPECVEISSLCLEDYGFIRDKGMAVDLNERIPPEQRQFLKQKFEVTR